MATAAEVQATLTVGFDSTTPSAYHTQFVHRFSSTDSILDVFRINVTTAQGTAQNIVASTVANRLTILMPESTANSPYRLVASTAEAGVFVTSGAICVLPLTTDNSGAAVYTTAGTTFGLLRIII